MDTLGPRPTPDDHALSPARRRVAVALETLGPRATLGALVERLRGHPNTTRQHLDALVSDGLAESAPVSGRGRGRPAFGYTLTPAGRRALAGGAARTAYSGLVHALASHLSAVGRIPEDARAIGRTWGAQQATDDLLGLLAALGFDPDPAPGGFGSGPAPRSAGSTASGSGPPPDVIHLRTCPILESARAAPEVVCEIHRGLLEGALGVTTADADRVRLVPFAEPGACLVLLDGADGDPGDSSARRQRTWPGTYAAAVG